MSIASIGVSAPVSTPDPTAINGKPQTAADDARDRAEQPPPRAPLPPGQGTRIDILA